MRARRFMTYRRRRTRLPDRPILRDVLFGTPELPVATVRSARSELHRRWAWLRPRAVPALVAFLALVGLLAVTKHLPKLAAPSDVATSVR